MTLNDINEQVQRWTDQIELSLYAGEVDLMGYEQFLKDLFAWAEQAARNADDRDAAETIADQRNRSSAIASERNRTVFRNERDDIGPVGADVPASRATRGSSSAGVRAPGTDVTDHDESQSVGSGRAQSEKREWIWPSRWP